MKNFKEYIISEDCNKSYEKVMAKQIVGTGND